MATNPDTLDDTTLAVYREILALKADERTLRGRELERLEAAIRTLGLSSQDVEADTEDFLRYRELSARLGEARALIDAEREGIKTATDEVEQYTSKLREAMIRRKQAQAKVEAANRPAAQLDELKRRNPRLFSNSPPASIAPAPACRQAPNGSPIPLNERSSRQDRSNISD